MEESTTWSCPDADDDGFVDYDVVKRKAAKLPREGFLEAFPMPALRVLYAGGEGPDAAPFDPEDSGVQLLTMAIKSTAVLRYLGRVTFVAKRPGNPYAHLVSIGRSSSNDITIAVDSVSRVHGYFVRDGGGWSFTDHGSTNGSRVGGRAVEQGEKVPLREGSELQIGLEVVLEFLPPESLYRKVTGRS